MLGPVAHKPHTRCQHRSILDDRFRIRTRPRFALIRLEALHTTVAGGLRLVHLGGKEELQV